MYAINDLIMLTAQCLYTMSEENETIIDLLKVPASQEVIATLLDKQSTTSFVKVITAGM